MTFRFLQVSDVHLGSRVRLRWLSQAQRGDLAASVGEAFRKAVLLAQERQVDVVLVPGDLFDEEAVRPDIVSWAASCFREIAPIPVCIAPGNHDPYCQTSPYHPLWSSQYPESAWPDNVRIFRDPEFVCTSVGDESACVAGVAHTRAGVLSERMLSRPIARPDACASLLLFHGSREFEGAPGKEKTLPFTDAELERQGFDWAAIGHYHSPLVIQAEDGRVIGGYSGCPQGRGLDECGEGCALIGEIEDGRVQVELVPVCERRIWSLDIPVDGKGAPEVISLVAAGLKGAADRDLVHVRLCGRASSEADLSLPPSLGARFFAFHQDFSGLEPDYDLDALAGTDGLSGMFVRRIREAAALDSVKEPLYRDAMTIGLDAIHGREVRPPRAP